MSQDILDLKQEILQEIQTTSISEKTRSIIDEIGEDKYAEFIAKLIIRVRKRFDPEAAKERSEELYRQYQMKNNMNNKKPKHKIIMYEVDQNNPAIQAYVKAWKEGYAKLSPEAKKFVDKERRNSILAQLERDGGVEVEYKKIR